MSKLTQSSLKELLAYNPETGGFVWRKTIGSRAIAGNVAGSRDSHGYSVIVIRGKNYKAHRLAWLHEFGAWPNGEIDHINGDRGDNAIHNLRVAKSRSEQLQNRGMASNNTSGYIGVCWIKDTEKWQVNIRVRGKQLHIGRFDSPEEADSAYRAAKRKYHTFCPELRE